MICFYGAHIGTSISVDVGRELYHRTDRYTVPIRTSKCQIRKKIVSRRSTFFLVDIRGMRTNWLRTLLHGNHSSRSREQKATLVARFFSAIFDLYGFDVALSAQLENLYALVSLLVSITARTRFFFTE